jgi:hypothetical protein
MNKLHLLRLHLLWLLRLLRLPDDARILYKPMPNIIAEGTMTEINTAAG